MGHPFGLKSCKSYTCLIETKIKKQPRERVLPAGSINCCKFIGECQLSEGKPFLNILQDNKILQAPSSRSVSGEYICMLGNCWQRYFGGSERRSAKRRCVPSRCAVLGLSGPATKGQRSGFLKSRSVSDLSESYERSAADICCKPK